MERTNVDFCLKIDFDKILKNPSRVFRAMSDLIEACQGIDQTLIKSIDSHIEPVLLLEDVEGSSIKAWLRQVIENIKDDNLKKLDWKPVVGEYLVKAKYLIVNFLSKTTEITNVDDIRVLESGLQKLAEETDVKHLPAYKPVSREELLNDINKISTALEPLDKERDKASYITQELESSFNLKISIGPDKIDELLTAQIISSPVPMPMILKIKKPEFLTDARWEFRHGTKPISAKIFDEEWLGRYQSGKIPIVPGDALSVDVRCEARYDREGNLIKESYDILKVHGVIPPPVGDQTTLLLSPQDEANKNEGSQ